MDAMDDPFPGVSWENALAALYEKFGNKQVRVPSSDGTTVVDVALANGNIFTAVLTWQQAKYLV
jgi:hypothetical protein